MADLTGITELIEKARAGDAGALDELFARCRPYLGLAARNRVEGWLRAKVDASDLVQQTMMEAYRGFQRFEGATEGEWLAWLKRILEHNAADFVRHYQGGKRHVGKEIVLDRPAEDSQAPMGIQPSAGDDSPSQAAIKGESELQLVAALQQLTDDHREVIVLRNLQRLPFDEVAARMGRTRPAAQMLWMRAIQKLQAIMTEK